MQVWTETTVAVASACAEAVASFLLDLGSPGLVTEESESVVTLTAYLAPNARSQLDALEAFCDRLRQTIAPDLPAARITTRRLQEQDWAHNWMDHFPPLAIGKRLYVVPPWIADVPAGRVAVVIDPGLAFGTGHHATTQGCLMLLEEIVAGGGVRRALDVGTGSGILAVALAKLGVSDVCAVDIDSEARRAAVENCRRNGVADRVHVGPDLAALGGSFDLIAANLLSSLLIELAPMLAVRVGRKGHVVASGILLAEVPSVAASFAEQALGESGRIATGEWVTLDLVRSS
jgi:ribosomal protein L11 methyltransferase